MELNQDYLLSSYNYELPSNAIAQTPAVPRDSSRLLVVDSLSTQVHRIFRDLPEFLLPNDLLILNNTLVIPARLCSRKSTGGFVEVLLLEKLSHNCWLALLKPGKRCKIGVELIFTPLPEKERELDFSLTAKVIDIDPATGGRVLEFQLPQQKTLEQFLDLFGQMPLPLYIKSPQSQPSQYQTVYAEKPGAVAAPTAGLHFTPELLAKLKDRGVEEAYITLHVGLGTFRPVEVEDITTHQMHQEWVEVSEKTVEQIEKTKAKGGRIIAVGTTAVRAIETAAQKAKEIEDKLLVPFCGKTNLFIYPGYPIRVVDGLITNFHLPGSSLLMLVSAFIGRDRLLYLYQEAIQQQYRFYSFGDAMLILPAACCRTHKGFNRIKHYY
jgi:S-adenosylmethionine:tRNA ribosyltransferase-isomerase